MAAANNFSLYVGEDVSFPVLLSQRQDITGWHLEFKARGAKTPGFILKDNQNVGGLDLVVPTDASAQVNFYHADTAGLTPDTFWWTLRRVDDGSNTVFASGSLYLLPTP